MKLAILLPITSRAAADVASCIENVHNNVLGSLRRPPRENPAGSAQGVDVAVIFGIDFDDPLRRHVVPLLQPFQAAGLEVHVQTFAETELRAARQRAQQQLLTASKTDDCLLTADGDHGSIHVAPLCWMWAELASTAAQIGCHLIVLLGDDTTVEPAGSWPGIVAEAFAVEPRLQCLLLKDAAEPGFPSFPVLGTDHLRSSAGRLLPQAFVNQDGDPFLHELYRSAEHGVASCREVTVVNTRGGVQLVGRGYTPPLYRRCFVPRAVFKRELALWRRRLAEQLAGCLTVDVLIPSHHADPAMLGRLLDAGSQIKDASIRFLLRIDQPPDSVCAATCAWLAARQNEMLNQLRLSYNAGNFGAAATRNALLEESAADYVILWDDDVQPRAGCLNAYIDAFRAHPDAHAFAGPSVLPHDDAPLHQGVHLSDASHFWEQPLRSAVVPWAVTANMALKQTAVRFNTIFPKTGGGEDIDFCLKIGQPLVSVPAAGVDHPWWPGGRMAIYRHLFGWAYGDGQLMDIHPALAYRRMPCAVECCFLLAVACLLRCSTVWNSVLAMCAVLLADLLLDVSASFLLQARWLLHPAPVGLARLQASCEAFLCKSSSEAGRLSGHLRRRRFGNIGRRFDWFAGLDPAVVSREQAHAAARMAAFLLSAAVALKATSAS